MPRLLRFMPLDGVRVINFSMGWAGPLCTRILADLGADLIKIEAIQYPHWWRGGGRPASAQAAEGEGRRLRTFAIACCSPAAGTLPTRRGGVNVRRCIELAVRPSSPSRRTGTVAPRSFLSVSWR